MFNPLDMLQAQNGAGMQTVAQQFGLTPEQTRRALEALMPAFALGMQRGPAGDPTGLSQLFGMAGGRTAPNPAETMLGQMFGSPALTQAILQQASSASGVGSQVLRQMLPAMAGAVVASIVHMLLNQQAPEPARAAPPPASTPPPTAPVWAEMMRAFLPAEAAAQPVKPQPQAAGPDATGGMFRHMLKAGAEVQEQNVKAMQGLFEAFWTETDAGRETRAGATGPEPHAGTDLPESPPGGPHRPRKGRPSTR
ncbi:DUF937 domain-containing protein [uncultured Methylobacterium sp.]|uniref:DUF937 domain-containing protein n=1 Tax=uncultured Methylobacterium sp. TaxID=157278 RepID=UPI0035CAC873